MALVYLNETGDILAYDARAEAPSAFNETIFCVDSTVCNESVAYFPDRVTGGLAVGVPGALALIDRLLHDYGTLSLPELVSPAQDIARVGFPMSEQLHHYILNNIERLALYDAS